MKQFLRPFSSISLIQEGLLSVTRESVCTKYWLTALSQDEKCSGRVVEC